jgi:hypothetical protein
LVISGSLMIRNVVDINWKYLGDAVPAFLTLIIIPCELISVKAVVATDEIVNLQSVLTSHMASLPVSSR